MDSNRQCSYTAPTLVDNPWRLSVADGVDIAISLAAGLIILVLGLKPTILLRTEENRKRYRHVPTVLVVGGIAMLIVGMVRLILLLSR
jgi:uncharacterized membrane protein YidH (DUF202 family)